MGRKGCKADVGEKMAGIVNGSGADVSSASIMHVGITIRGKFINCHRHIQF